MHSTGLLGAPRAARLISWYVAGALLLTLAWLLALALAPAAGLTRSFYYGLPRDADPLALDLRELTAVEDLAEDVDLAFLERYDWLTRDYFVRWRGVWFSPRAERIDVHASAEDGVVVRVDGTVLIEHHRAAGTDPETRSVELGAGAHTLEIDYWQRGESRRLSVQWAPSGAEPLPLRSGRLFPDDPGAGGYWLWAAAEQPMLVLFAWTGGPVILLGGLMVRRRIEALAAGEVRRRLWTATLPALLGPSQVLLFGPWTVYATNRAEFLAPFWILGVRWILLLAILGGLLAAVGLLLPPRAFRRYVAGLGAAGLLLWMQGNLLVADYGLLDGSGLDLAAHTWRVPLDVGLWVGVLAVALIFAVAVSRVAPTASALLLALQAAVLILPPLAPAEASPTPSDAAERWRVPPPEIFELSTDRNLIHIVLDTYPSNLFAAILDAERPAFDRGWSGFTFFRDHLGAFTGTRPSMPAMLTGIAWRNDVPIGSFVQRHPTVFHELGKQGYRLRLLAHGSRDFPSDRFPGAESALGYIIPHPLGIYRDYTDSASAQLLDLALFRHAPHGAKASIYRDGRWFLQSRAARRREAAIGAPRQALGDPAFLQEFARRIVAGDDEPLYTFLHMLTPHPPIVTDANCAYTGRRLRMTPVNFRAQARCALRAVESLLDRLRELDLYDRSAIVITSDHGTTLFPRRPNPLANIQTPGGVSLHAVELFATPLLLLKPFDAHGPVHTSHAPTAITDLPATLLDLAGLPNTFATGTSALSLNTDTPRQRTFAYHSWVGQGPNTPQSQRMDVLHLFSVDGRVTDPDAWRHRRAVFEPTDDRAAQRRGHRVGFWEDPIDAAEHAGGAAFWTGDYAAFFVPANTGRVTFDVRKAPNLGEQTLTVRVDGDVVGRHALTDDAWHTLDYTMPPRDAANSPFSVQLQVSPVWRNTDDTPRGVQVRGDF